VNGELLFTVDQIRQVVEVALHAREALVARGMAPGDALVMSGCALGTMLCGGIPGDLTAR
jgi:hypothetical protein